MLIDWQRFYAGNVLDDLPETHLIYSNRDTAFIQYQKDEYNTKLFIRDYKLRNIILNKEIKILQ